MLEGIAFLFEIYALFKSNTQLHREGKWVKIDFMFEFQQVARFLNFVKGSVMRDYADARLTVENKALGIVSVGGTNRVASPITSETHSMFVDTKHHLIQAVQKLLN